VQFSCLGKPVNLSLRLNTHALAHRLCMLVIETAKCRRRLQTLYMAYIT